MNPLDPSLPAQAAPASGAERLLDVLTRLNEIGAAINRMSGGDLTGVEMTLRLIAENAIQVVGSDPTVETAIPGRASTVIYTYDAVAGAFDPASRVSAGVLSQPIPGDEPRPKGMGMRAVRLRRRLLSYEEPDVAMHPALRAAGALAMVCYPLVVAEQPLGVLYVFLHEDRRFGPLELLMLDNFVNQAAMTLHQAQQMAQVRRDLQRKEDELVRLRHADLLISSRLRLEETLEAILQMALEVTGARYGIFRLVDRAGKQLVTSAVAGEDLGRPAIETLPINATSITGWVAKYRQPLVIPDVREGKWSRLYYPLDHDLEMRSELAVPLLGASGRLEGVLNLESPKVGAFSEDDRLLLQSLATQAVIAIQEVRLLDALQEIAERLLVEPLQQVFVRLAALACDLLNVPVALLWTLEGETLVWQAGYGADLAGTRIPLHASFSGQAIRERVPVVAADVRQDARFHLPDLARARGWSVALSAPLLAGDEGDPVGALGVIDVESGSFAASDWDKKVLTSLAHHAALAVQNAARQEALRQARAQRAAAETFAALGDIAANLLHRLNNKIGAIPVRVEGIEDKSAAALAGDEYLARNLGEIKRSAAEAMEIMRESLLHLRPIHLAPVDVAACVQEALAGCDLPPAVHVHIEGLESLPPVLAGQKRLGLVFANLIENALTALGGQGEIWIVGRHVQDRVEIEVRDNGPGIPPALHERIFDFNFSGAKRASAKLGFGLWWVRTIMARFGGDISVESDGVHGASFRLRLPLQAEK